MAGSVIENALVRVLLQISLVIWSVHTNFFADHAGRICHSFAIAW